MANIFEYLEWRSDIPFSQDSFNEVDNLVLAQLAYTDFDGCIHEQGFTSLKEVYEKYYQIHTREEILARTSFIAKAPLLMDTMVDSVRYGGIRFKKYVNIINGNKNEQMSAVQMWLPDETVYVAYRGTDDTFIGWKEDLCFSYMEETEGQRQSLKYLNDCFQTTKLKLRVGGHSKGGNFAVYASAFCDENVQNQIIEVWSNDGPGFMHEVTEKEQYQMIQPKIKAIVPECSVIGMLMYSLGEKKVILSSGKGMMQHDANTWQLKRNHFITVDGRSSQSILADKTIRGWLKDLSLEDRKIFVNTVFDVLEASGATCVSEFNKSIITNVPKILMRLTKLSKEQAENFKKVIFHFAKSYASESVDSLEESVTKYINQIWNKS